jgi:hypothetical protein
MALGLERIPYMTLVLKYDALCDTFNFLLPSMATCVKFMPHMTL